MTNLVLHNPKFDSKLTTFDALRQLPIPVPQGRNHKPVPHVALVEALHGEIATRGYSIKREQLALGHEGDALFGVIDLVPGADGVYAPADNGRGLSIGFRNSVDQSMALSAVAGSRVFVCDNLALSGSVFAIQRKNTTGLDLGDAVANGFDKFLAQSQRFEIDLVRIQGEVITDEDAKRIVYDIFAARVVPTRLFDDVDRFYFRPGDEMADCQPRTKWGLYNAFTRAMKDLTPTRLFGATVALGERLGLGTGVEEN